MSKKFSTPRGTADILPEQMAAWQQLEFKARKLLTTYGYKEIRTPAFEETELFARSMGQSSDVVQKQMLSLNSQKKSDADDIKSSLSLRPEGTASIVRSYIQNSMDKKENLTKLYYMGPMFRGERPQKGRLRQFNQIGVEAIGPDTRSPFLDAEVIALSVNLLKALGVSDLEVQINTLGTFDDKKNFIQLLKKKLKPELGQLCDDCKSRYTKNVLRVLDCKNKSCQKIVIRLGLGGDWLSNESRAYFDDVKKALAALSIPFVENASLVRGLDYYTQTVFEITSPLLESQQNTLAAGGRYDSLVRQLGGPDVDAVGFALGIERVLLVSDLPKKALQPRLDVYILALDDGAFEPAFKQLKILRENNISSDINYRITSVKSQMRQADKSGARFVLLFGEDEIRNNFATLKNMETGEQTRIDDPSNSIDKLINAIQG